MAELDYDERANNFNTTCTTLFATTGVGSATPVIGGLEVNVTGTGDPVVVSFYTPAMGNPGGWLVASWFIVTVNAGSPVVTPALSQYRTWTTAGGANPGGTMTRRLVLEDGVAYKYQVGLSAAGLSITTAYGQQTSGGASAGIMHLRVTD